MVRQARRHPGALSSSLRYLWLAAGLLIGSHAWSGTPGEDGNVTITAANQVINGYTTLSAGVAANAASFTVTSVAALTLPAGSGVSVNTTLAAGDLLLIYQPNGATIDTTNSLANYGAVSAYNSAGKYEFVTVRTIATNTITIATGTQSVGGRACTGLLNAYASGAMVVRVPQYNNFTINAAASAIAADWAGTTGGVVVADVRTTLTVNGSILADANGFRGGVYADNANASGTDYTAIVRSTDNNDGGEKGESIGGYQASYTNGRYGRGAPANGGGGGNGHNSGGGGGANGGTGTWTGTGSPFRGAANAFDAAWNLESAGFATSSSPGGGRGGYSFSGNDQNAGTLAPGSTNWAGNLRRVTGGLGGRPLDRTGDRLFLGGGGGSGDGNNFAGDNGDGNNTTGNGGDGGGLIFLVAGSIAGSGTISANGANGGSSSAGASGSGGRDGPGGAGAGGTVVVVSDGTLANTLTVRANGGTGGTQNIVGFGNEAEGPGGGGGGGVVAITSTGGTPTVQVTAGASGTTNSAGLTEFNVNGATRGLAGTSTTGPGRTSGPLACALPVTLGYIESWRDGAAIGVRFATASETQNVGFRIYGVDAGGAKRGIEVTVPSAVVDSVIAQDYRTRVVSDADRLMIDDIATDGTVTAHGPYLVGQRYGYDGKPDLIDWASIRADAKSALVHSKSLAASAALSVRADGIYRLERADLSAAGVSLDGALSAEIALTRDGAPVLRRVIGGERFGAGSAIEFFGQARQSLYGRAAVYRLSIDAAHAEPMADDASRATSAVPVAFDAIAEYAPNRNYSFASVLPDPWFADALLAFRGSTARANIDLRIDGPLPEAGPAQLTLSLWGVTTWPGEEADHRLNVLLNDSYLGGARADGLIAFGFERELDTASLQPGLNRLVVEVPGDGGVDFDLVNLESARLQYPSRPYASNYRWDGAHVRALTPTTLATAGFAVPGFFDDQFSAYRMDSDGTVVRLSGVARDRAQTCCAALLPLGAADAHYWVSATSAALKPDIAALQPATPIFTGAADYLIVTHGAFAAGLDELVALHTAEGLHVKVVDVAQIYQQLSDAQPDPEAIKNYIAFAAAELGTHYVLLVGADSYDYDDNLGIGAMSFVPTFYRSTGSVVRFAPTDAPYADIDDDGLPDLAIGRFPVRTRSELRVMVAKTLAYVARSDKAKALLVAGATEDGYTFKQLGQELGRDLDAAGYATSRAYVDDLGAQGARNELLATLNQGVPLVGFIGHSGVDRWTFDPLFTIADARDLSNVGMPGVYLQAGCWNTYFASPTANTLAHALLFNPNGGAAAVLGAASLTDSGAHEDLDRVIYPMLAQGVSLGDSLRQAQRQLVSSAYAQQILLGITLLGDPALKAR